MATIVDRGVPKGMRIGQFISNFTAWLDERGIDLFYVQDEQYMKLYDDYVTSISIK